jgi:DNA-binding response OmpR family regulator
MAISKILMVDNDLDFIEAVRNFLEAAGFEVDQEHREEEAMAKMRAFQPDLVLLDVVMDRDRSGFEIAEQIYRDGGLQRVPVVFLTGYFKRAGTPEEEKDILSRWNNVRRILDKPVRPELLLRVIKEIDAEKA